MQAESKEEAHSVSSFDSIDHDQRTHDRVCSRSTDRDFPWAEVQHCVNAYDSDLFLAVQRGDAEIQDESGDRIGWGGFAGDGQHIYVRPAPNVPSPH